MCVKIRNFIFSDRIDKLNWQIEYHEIKSIFAIIRNDKKRYNLKKKRIAKKNQNTISSVYFHAALIPNFLLDQ